MFDILIHKITDLGDGAVTGSLTIVSASYLLYSREKRAAAAVVLAFALSAAATACLKLFFYSACSPILFSTSLHSPSGHSALSVAVYGTIAAIIASSLPARLRLFPYLLVLMLAVPIAVSRVLVGAHTIPEVVMGFGVGLIVAFGVWRALLKGRVVLHGPVLPLVGLALAAMLILNGVQFPGERLIEWLAVHIRMHIHAC